MSKEVLLIQPYPDSDFLQLISRLTIDLLGGELEMLSLELRGESDVHPIELVCKLNSIVKNVNEELPVMLGQVNFDKIETLLSWSSPTDFYLVVKPKDTGTKDYSLSMLVH